MLVYPIKKLVNNSSASSKELAFVTRATGFLGAKSFQVPAPSSLPNGSFHTLGVLLCGLITTERDALGLRKTALLLGVHIEAPDSWKLSSEPGFEVMGPFFGT